MPESSVPREIAFRVVILDPPPGVRFQMQRGSGELVPPARGNARELVFEFSLRPGEPLPDGRPRFLGPFAQGPPDGRFVYVNSGTAAGQPGSPWSRRAKLPLGSIDARAVAQVLAQPRARLEVRIPGVGKDGGPVCATVPLPEGWSVVES
ncbi:MAG: DUF5990 family protein [Thermoanaerobaculia bacterium]